MTHSRMLDHVPSVCITHDRNELKLYQGNIVYLNDGDNFELRFFNPTVFKLGTEILFNGIKKGDAYLVLNPGQDIILDRFLDEQRKMLFETYVINGENAEAVKAIEQNGVITFNFYKEYYRSNYNQPIVNVNYNFPPRPAKPIKYKSNFGNYYHCSGSGTSGAAGVSGASGASGTSGSGGGNSTTTNTNSRIYSSSTLTSSLSDLTINTTNTIHIPHNKDYWFPCNSSESFTMDSFSDNYSNSTTHITTYATNPLETGRIEKGDISGQYLKTVNAEFAPTPFHSVTYKIMPYSAMNHTIGEVRMYCSSCGYRLRKETWQFCPKCGAEIL